MNPRHFISLLGCMLVAASCATDAAKSAANPPAKARNVILFIGDGMGIATVTATRILDGQRRGGQGEDNVLSFEKFPYTAFSKTYTYDFQVGESAGTITAMMSGQKTHSAVLGEGPAVTPGKCEGAAAATSTRGGRRTAAARPQPRPGCRRQCVWPPPPRGANPCHRPEW